MSNSRYYVVGDRDVWTVQCPPVEQGQCASRSEVIAFAISAAQKLGMGGERAHVCMLDRYGRLQSKWTFNRQRPVSTGTLRFPDVMLRSRPELITIS